ncbi:limbic system-associated membrane protein-like [Argopecten irradians]|uniref:limbic system-associated membrane protein-like n=1 Tax=Argopecten irradians TaxID=31199 RepID=UPI00372277B3
MLFFLTGKPPQLSFPSTKITTGEGGNVILRCTVESDIPTTEISWYKGNKEIPNDGLKYIGSNTPSLVIVELKKDDDQGTYHCEAENINGRGRSADLALEISPTGPTPDITYPSAKVTTREGDNAVLRFAISSDITTDISWYKEDTRIDHDDMKYTGSDSPSLVITDIIKFADEGNYHCEAKNLYGKTQSQDVFLQVLPREGRPRTGRGDTD